MGKLIYGKNSVIDALKNSHPVTTLYLAKPLNIKIDDNINVFIKDKMALNKMIKGNHQGYIAELKEFNYFNLDTILKDRPEKILILDHIQDPNNFGAIIRSANAAGVKHIIIPKNRQVEVTGSVIKVSSGGYIGIKIIRVNSLVDAIMKLKKAKFWIYASSLKNGVSIEEVKYNKPTALIVGNEQKGVSNSILKLSDQNIYIPMKGTVQSLNVSVAAGILLFNE